MYWKASEIKGYAIMASDGKIGTVDDFLFNDDSWLVRWLVIDTGDRHSGGKVLLPPFVLGHPDPTKREFPVGLTVARVKDCADIDTDRPVSRQIESRVYERQGWRPYWANDDETDANGHSADGSLLAPGLCVRDFAKRDGDDPHLRSIQTVTGYNIQAVDGGIGHVEDMLVADVDWRIPYLVVDTKNWWPSKKILVSPSSVHAIDWSNRLVSLDVDRREIESSPEYRASITTDPDFEKAFRDQPLLRWAEEE